MDVFAITCTKHLCYVAADGEDLPYCPKAFAENMSSFGQECKNDWHIFRSDNQHMLLTEHVRTAVHDLNGIVNRLNNQVKPIIEVQ